MKYYYQIEYGQKDLINSSPFFEFEDAINAYNNTPNNCKSNQDSIVCLDQNNNFNDRFDLTNKVWENEI